MEPRAKLKILALEPRGTRHKVVAQFNPKEVQIDKSVPWKPQARRGTSDLEYTGCDPRTMSLELLFDGFDTGLSVQGALDDLNRLTQSFGTGRDERRPPKVKVIWGTDDTASVNLPEFNGVVESVSIKYTMFSGEGVVLRATASVKLKEALRPGIEGRR
jgi:hypothetical protein